MPDDHTHFDAAQQTPTPAATTDATAAPARVPREQRRSAKVRRASKRAAR